MALALAESVAERLEADALAEEDWLADAEAEAEEEADEDAVEETEEETVEEVCPPSLKMRISLTLK